MNKRLPSLQSGFCRVLGPVPGLHGLRTYAQAVTLDVVHQAEALAAARLAELPRRWSHVQGVAGVASSVAQRLDPGNADAIVAAAWLHDVGYSRNLAATGFHPIDGANFARDAGLPELVVSLIAYHSGAAVEADERGLGAELSHIPPPPDDVLDVLTFADMTTSPDGATVSAPERVREILSRYTEDDPVYGAVSRSGPDLLAAVDRVRERLDRVQPR